MTDALNTLLALQDHDTTVDQLRVRVATLPERRTNAELRARAETNVATIERLTAQRDELAGRQRAIDREVNAARTKQADLTKRLSATSVSREAQTLQHELEMARDRQRALEDDELVVMEALEPIESELASATALRQTLANELAMSNDALEAASNACNTELGELSRARPALEAAVPPALLKRYDVLRPKLNGVAVARVVGGHCSGCNLSLPTSELQRLRSLPPDELAECEQCGRMLVP